MKTDFDEIRDPDLQEGEMQVWENLKKRILILTDRAWEGKITWSTVERWLANFNGSTGATPSIERLHALYLLAQFMYFGVRETRVLLKALYRDLVLAPIIQEVRTRNGNTRDSAFVSREVTMELNRTRFIGVGNASESGPFLLYFFRQENGLSKLHFLNDADIFHKVLHNGQMHVLLQDPSIRRYIFLDDLCGSGDTADKYSRRVVQHLVALNPQVQASYLCLFATSDGLEVARKTSFGDNCGAVLELDETYKCLGANSRYLVVKPDCINPDILRAVSTTYGNAIIPGHANGFSDGQLLLGFNYNTPDNTLPIIWGERANGSLVSWAPAFKRFPKV